MRIKIFIKVSILIPAFREEQNIQKTIKTLQEYLAPLDFEEEMIVVCDGNGDRTFDYAKKLENEKTMVLNYKINQGKGYALKYGFERSSGDLVIFFDAGLDFPPADIQRFIEYYQKTKTPVIIGSKRHPESKINYIWKRRLISFSGQVLTRILFNFNVRDTQVGLKLFERSVLEKIFPRVMIKKYAFDIELLVLARYFGYEILEAPVNLTLNWKNGSGITWQAVRDCFLDTLAVFYRLKILKYYDKIHEKEGL